MKPAELAVRLDRVQRSTLFKVIASIVVAVAAIGAVVSYSVAVTAAKGDLRLLEVAPAAPETPAQAGEDQATRQAHEQVAKSMRESAESFARTVNSVLERRLSIASFGIGAALITAVMLVVIWLNLAFTYLAVLAAGLLVAGPMLWWGNAWWRGLGTFMIGSLLLAATFSALLQSLRIALSGSHPVLSIARNVLAEAVRMKISLVFIVMLILALAALPGLLDADTPLRYRVQAFLTYGTGGTFWISAVMVLFLGCGSVAFEQRDKIIWQTMTKPVAPWQYIAGKWLGVSAMAAVLLGVSCSGVFLFTEFLRSQRAMGESAPFVSAGNEPIASDRLLLETQVLTARESRLPFLPVRDNKAFIQEIDRRLERLKAEDPNTSDTPETRAQIATAMNQEEMTAFLAIEPGQSQTYTFEGLEYARESGLPLTLRFKVNAGSNIPTETYRVTFYVDNASPFVLECRLGQKISEPLAPSAVAANGELKLEIFNGDLMRRIPNRETMSFPPDGLEIFYPVGGFRANFARVVLVMWLKLSFLAMIAIAASTFLSFPVAALTSFGVLFCAESASYVQSALEQWSVFGLEGEVYYWRYPITWISQAVSSLFAFYASIQPTATLADGQVVGWRPVLVTMTVLGGMSVVLGAAASWIFQRRELATYSGQ